MKMKKTFYTLYLVKADGEEEFLAKVKTQGLAMRTKMLYNINTCKLFKKHQKGDRNS